MSHFVYLALLLACLVGTVPLETVLHVHVYAQWRRLAGAVLPVTIVFTAWDLFSIRRALWHYDGHYLVAIRLPGRLPLEELLFFIVIPICAVLTYEAVLGRRPEWPR